MKSTKKKQIQPVLQDHQIQKIMKKKIVKDEESESR